MWLIISRACPLPNVLPPLEDEEKSERVLHGAGVTV